MKTINVTLLCSVLLLLAACQKEVVTKPVSFKGTEYAFLAPYDDNGKPLNVQNEPVSPELYSFMRNSLPEQKDLRNSPLYTNNPTTDISITQRSEVFVTFLSTGASNKNAVAFYTYPTSTPPVKPSDIKKITYIYPNTGHNSTTLTAGDKVRLGTFDPGVSIGFVLLQDAWKTDTKKPNNESVHFCYNDALNPEVDPSLKKHVVLVNYAQENKVLVGFEDIDRTKKECDHDFNDVVVFVTINK
jgi:hypothetical protein